MTIYIAFLRGINVGGHRRVKMDVLRDLFERIGCSHAHTYIQSGNVLFASEKEEKELRASIEQEILSVFGFPVTVALRTSNDLEKLIANSAYPVDSLTKEEQLYVALLVDEPEPKRIDRLCAYRHEIDDYRIIGREIYILYRQGAHKSALTNAFFERQLGVAATSRNWQTITKLCDLAVAMRS